MSAHFSLFVSPVEKGQPETGGKKINERKTHHIVTRGTFLKAGDSLSLMLADTTVQHAYTTLTLFNALHHYAHQHYFYYTYLTLLPLDTQHC